MRNTAVMHPRVEVSSRLSQYSSWVMFHVYRRCHVTGPQVLCLCRGRWPWSSPTTSHTETSPGSRRSRRRRRGRSSSSSTPRWWRWQRMSERRLWWTVTLSSSLVRPASVWRRVWRRGWRGQWQWFRNQRSQSRRHYQSLSNQRRESRPAKSIHDVTAICYRWKQLASLISKSDVFCLFKT